MPNIHLYPYPFDVRGHQALTLQEVVAAMRDLELQLHALLPSGWRWCDLRLHIIERHPTYVIYTVEHHEKHIGRAIVLPHCADPPITGPNSPLEDQKWLSSPARRSPGRPAEDPSD